MTRSVRNGRNVNLRGVIIFVDSKRWKLRRTFINVHRSYLQRWNLLCKARNASTRKLLRHPLKILASRRRSYYRGKSARRAQILDPAWAAKPRVLTYKETRLITRILIFISWLVSRKRYPLSRKRRQSSTRQTLQLQAMESLVVRWRSLRNTSVLIVIHRHLLLVSRESLLTWFSKPYGMSPLIMMLLHVASRLQVDDRRICR